MSRPVPDSTHFVSEAGNQPASQLDTWFSNLRGAINDSASGWVNVGTDTGGANTYVITLVPPPSGYESGFTIAFSPANTNTGGSTINVNGLGSVAIVRADGTAAQPGDIVAGRLLTIIYTGANFQIVGEPAGESGITGEIKMYGNATAPAGYVNCDGTAYSRTTYSALFAVIGVSYGSGDGSTTFNVPSMSGNYAKAATVGTTGGSNTIAVANLPAHKHTLTDPGHFHSTPNGLNSTGIQAAFAAGGGAAVGGTSWITAGAPTGITMANTGSGNAYDMPFVGFNFIIKT